MESLRDIGYELPAAVADLVDNSIDADATRVDVTVTFEGASSWIRVADNGTGMPTQLMNEAMRYGTDRSYGETDLGKFGLGLKTASLSQCRRLTVATRTNPQRREIEIRRWDLDHVMDEDRWQLLRLSPSEARDEMTTPLQDGPGTVVMWEMLDRVLDYRLPSGLAAERGLSMICRDIEAHLAMVFHRFLAQQARRALPLRITLQGNEVDPWDPFARGEMATQRLDRQTISLRYDGRTHTIRVQPYVLPNQVQFSTARAWEIASGPKKWNRQQGFYIYRGGRMVQSGGWSRLRTPDEHTKLARIAIDIPRGTDTAFGINVSKMRVLIPTDIRAELKAIASAVTSRAQAVYRQNGNRQPGTAGSGGRPGARGAGPSSATSAAASGFTTANGADREPLVPWHVIYDVLSEQLADHPSLIQRILDALSDVVDGRGHATEGGTSS
jgi:Histidine kinase-, DNA gyrase B-, and HSP90-like ATPase